MDQGLSAARGLPINALAQELAWMNRRALPSLLTSLTICIGTTTATPVLAGDIDTLVQRFIDTAAALPGYQVVMTKQQRTGHELSDEETILLKHRRTPECRYFKWIDKPHKNREAIYCANRYHGKMRVHEPLLMGLTVSVDPEGLLAREGNLRPVQQSGIYNMARMLQVDIEQRKAGHTLFPPGIDRDVDGQHSLCLRREEMPSDSAATYPIAAGELCFDKLSAMPTEIRIWHRDGRLMERYGFRDWVLDRALSDKDFDTDNPDYGF